MAADKARAIVIRTYPFGGNSCVVSLFTREFGKLRGLAKGAWRPKGGFDAALDLLSICQVLVLRRSTDGLDLLTEAFLEHRFRVGRSLEAFLGGLDVAELLDALTADADPQPELFDVAHSTLRILSAPARNHAADASTIDPPARLVRAVVTRFELAALRLVGHGPALRACGECGGGVDGGPRIAFGMLDGGVLCGRCRRGKRAVVSVSAEAVAVLRLLGDASDHRAMATVREPPDLPPSIDGEVRAVMSTFLSHLLGRRPRVAPLLKPTVLPAPAS